jgi:hypothetical protein
MWGESVGGSAAAERASRRVRQQLKQMLAQRTAKFGVGSSSPCMTVLPHLSLAGLVRASCSHVNSG